ncbi:MAG: phosphoribosyltransferase [Pseudomonadota bacterium]
MEPHEFWQAFEPGSATLTSPYTDRYPAVMGDGPVLALPIRPLAGTENAIASLILNQASFAVEAALAEVLAARVAEVAPDIIVGLPTLGLSLARLVAQRLGHARYVALGTSRKFWYDSGLSVPLNSITSPGQEKRLYVDPRMLPLLRGQRVCLIDDVISSGASIRAGVDVLGLAGVRPVALGAAMLQTRRWFDAVSDVEVPVFGAFETPLLKKAEGGWVEVD